MIIAIVAIIRIAIFPVYYRIKENTNMSLPSQQTIELINDRSVTKVIATLDEHGAPYAVISEFLQLGENGQLVHLELLEKSASNRNLLRSLWFEKKISVTLYAASGESYVIAGRPVKAHISGPVFRHYYQQVRSAIADGDLSTVWLIEPEEVVDETYTTRKQQEEEQFPFTVHLDRLTTSIA
jgi:hypothetical protein